MPALVPSEAVEAVHHQVRQVRRRWNLREFQRGLYLLLGVAAAAVTVVLLLALRAPDALFVPAAAAVAAAAVAAATAAILAVRRHWLRVRDAATVIDRQSALGGRLATLVELDARPPADPFLLPLLVEQNLGSLPAWRPRRLVARAVPLRELGAALGTAGALLAALALAPMLAPVPPEPPGGGIVLRGDGSGRRLPARALHIEPEEVQPVPGEDPVSGMLRPGALDGDPQALQERIRDAVWGEGWERVRTVTAPGARTARERRPVERHPGSANSPRGGAGARAEGGRRASGDEEGGASEDAEGRGRAAALAAARRTGTARAHTGHPADGTGPAGSGAGTGSDPRLYAEPSDLVHTGGDPFVLGIRARVRVLRAGPRPPSGEAPEAAPDAEPRLASRPRLEAPVGRISVPAAYEPIVRRLFAHEDVRR
jgi:hypothetical protein